MGLMKEFREFAIKGNMVDMAVGIIIGAAFGGLVKSLVDDVVMPAVGMIWKADFTNLYIPLNAGVRAKMTEHAAANADAVLPLAQARAAGAVLAYGNFITLFINFIILAFVIFMVVKMINRARKRFEHEQAAAPAAPPPTPEDVLLLREIRDSLKTR
ncbi:MAG: large conductance mechanosensitive channel protein MscL [Phycisphaerales bacterium]|nr:large conductance mechanosensitive channel protein MscL [Phycisphaerales bacterium]